MSFTKQHKSHIYQLTQSLQCLLPQLAIIKEITFLDQCVFHTTIASYLNDLTMLRAKKVILPLSSHLIQMCLHKKTSHLKTSNKYTMHYSIPKLNQIQLVNLKALELLFDIPKFEKKNPWRGHGNLEKSLYILESRRKWETFKERDKH